MDNKIICGDCLDAVKRIRFPVDFIYMDPPFTGNETYTDIWEKNDEELSYHDHWEAGVLGYCDWLKKRVEVLYEVLKETGVMCVHCDWHANAYIRVNVLDEIFPKRNFINEIIVRRKIYSKGSQFDPRSLPNLYDTILVYSKSKDYLFNKDAVLIKRTQEELEDLYPLIDEKGRHHIKGILRNKSMCERQKLVYEYKGFTPDKWGWAVKKDKLIEIDNRGDLIFDKNGTPKRKKRIWEDRGVSIGNIWDDVNKFKSGEKLGYPTQKPEVLLERLIKIFTNEHETVLDPFVGSGTTCVASARLKRNFIGIDLYKKSIEVTNDRLSSLTTDSNNPYFEFEVIVPKTIEELKSAHWLYVQDWVNERLGAYSGKKGRDGGQDGSTSHEITNVFDIARKEVVDVPKGSLIQVKHYVDSPLGIPILKEFETSIRDHKKNVGILVGWRFSTPEALSFSIKREKDGIKIYLVTIEWLHGQPILSGPRQEVISIKQTRIKQTMTTTEEIE